MKKYSLSFLIITLFTFCNKTQPEKRCLSPEYCLGKHTTHLTDTDTSYVITNDTIFCFKNTENNSDIIKLKYVKHYTDYYNSKRYCSCDGDNTDITYEAFNGTYKFLMNSENYNILAKKYALKYSITSSINEEKNFQINFSDSDAIFNNIYYQTSPSSQFQVNNIVKKGNDIDSMTINGKLYRDIIKNFDSKGIGAYSVFTECYYSKKFGIVRFTYNNSVYEIVP